MSTFVSIQSLRLNLTEPTVYSCGVLPVPEYLCTYDGEKFAITVRGRIRELELSSPYLRRIRHEIVADLMEFSSDKALFHIGAVGDDGLLTPDFINLDDKNVIELATTAISQEFALKNAYSGKIIKYSYIVQPLGFDLIVIVVAKDLVYANCYLSQEVVDELCYRMRIGMAIEVVVNEYLGYDIFSDDSTANEAIVSDVFRGLRPETISSYDFDMDVISDMTSIPSNEEWQHAGRIMRKTKDLSRNKSSETDNTLRNYLFKFEDTSKVSDKRVCNLPFVVRRKKLLSLNLNFDTTLAKDMPQHLKKIWLESEQVVPQEINKMNLIEEAMGRVEFQKHRIQKASMFKVKSLSDVDLLEAAKSGLWAKAFKSNEEMKEKRIDDSKSFNPLKTETADIEEFINGIHMTENPNAQVPLDIFRLLEKGKSVWKDGGHLSLKVFSKLTQTKLMSMAQMISNVMSEISYCYKSWNGKYDFYHKRHLNVHILVRCTSSHIFALFAFPKAEFKCFDTGRLGPTLWESENYIYSDICSFNEPAIEHFLKSAPYMTAIVSHILSHLEMSVHKLDITNKLYNQHINSIFLLYLCNKSDCEELITSQRYLTMGVLEELDPNPYRFVARLPEVFRSRLTVYFFKKTIEHMNHYERHRIYKLPNVSDMEYDIKYCGIQSLFGDYEPSLKQKINEFYFGYSISKEKGRSNDRNFKIMKKIVSEEYKYRDTVKSTFGYGEPKVHVSDPIMIKVFTHLFKEQLRGILGSDFESVIHQDIRRAMSRASFTELATLKVSSRTYKESIVVPSLKVGMTSKEIRTSYEEENENEKAKRPKVMEALSSLIEEIEKSNGKPLQHPIEMIPYCITDISRRGYWDSDIFPKAQHGGDREIHVLEIKMRVLQFFLELISKTLCRYITSDTLTHPRSKDNFIRDHHIQAQQVFGQRYFTVGKSADATRWCQRNDSSKFAAMISPLVPAEYRSFFIHVLSLWKCKRISFPIQFAANFQNNKDVISNPIYMRMRKEFLTGTGIFYQRCSNKIMIRSGMMQGILHYTSSLSHGIIQEVMKTFQMKFLAKKGIPSYITVVQGSDDSAELLSLKDGATISKMRLATLLLNWKEKVSMYFSIYCNREKSSISTLELVEYNSEWYIKNNPMKPTFRWVSACLETGIVERFIDRVRTNYNISSQVLEGGGKVLEVALIQLCQAWLHYMLLGMHNSDISREVRIEMIQNPDPAFGFYPLDSDYVAGITGVEFQIFKLYLSTNYGTGLSLKSLQNSEIYTSIDEIEECDVGQALRRVRVKFSDMKLWKAQMRRMNIPDLLRIIEEIEENPYLLYLDLKAWKEAKFAIFLKMFQPGVKESISSHSATVRMMAASAYIFSRPCVSLFNDGQPIKLSLLHALVREREISYGKSKLPVEEVFTHAEEYHEVVQFVDHLENSSVLMQSQFRTRSKQKICVFEKIVDDVSLIDLCKLKWFNVGSVALSSRQLDVFWDAAKLKYPFIRDDRAETKEMLGMNEVELKGFLESIVTKPRHIVLFDTTARSPSLTGSVTRIFWNNIKVSAENRKKEDDSSFSLRSRIFVIISSFLSNQIKEEMIKTLIIKSDMLSQRRVPVKVKHLRIFHNWFTSTNKFLLVKQIADEHLGSVGFFTVRQKGWGKNRTGYGEWKGICLESSVIIRMEGNTCVEIIVDKLHNMRLLGGVLKDMIKSFSLDPPDYEMYGECWLMQSGKITGGFGKPGSIPISIQPSLKVNIVDKVAEYAWSWEVNRNRIRIIANIDRDNFITILSDTFTNKDWDPQFSKNEDGFLRFWGCGEPMPLEILKKELDSTIIGSQHDAFKMYTRRYTIESFSGWNLGHLLDEIKRMIIRDVYLVPEEDDDEDASAETQLNKKSKMSYEDIMDQCDTIDVDVANLSLEGMTEFDENDLDSEDYFAVSAEDYDSFSKQIGLFSSTNLEGFCMPDDKNNMPSYNMFFSNLNSVCRNIYGFSSFKEMVITFRESTSRTVEDYMGVLLSLLCGRDCTTSSVVTISSVEDAEKASELLSREFLNNPSLVDTERIIRSLRYLRDMIYRAPYDLRPRISMVIQNYKDILYKKTSYNKNSGDFEWTDIDSIVEPLKKRLLELKKIPTSFSLINNDAFIEILKAELSLELDERLEKKLIQVHQHSILKESLSKTKITTMFLDVISWKYDLEIHFRSYVSHGSDVVDLDF